MNNIALKTAINLNSNTSTVLQQGMIKNNAPFYNNALSPFYKKNKVLEEGEVVINDTLTFNKLTGELKDNGVIIHTFTGLKLKKTIVENYLLFHKEDGNLFEITQGIDDFTIKITGDINSSYSESLRDIEKVGLISQDSVGQTGGICFYIITTTGIRNNVYLYQYNETTNEIDKSSVTIFLDSGVTGKLIYIEDIDRYLFVTSKGEFYATSDLLASFPKITSFNYIGANETNAIVPRVVTYEGVVIANPVGSNRTGDVAVNSIGTITAISGSTATVTIEEDDIYILTDVVDMDKSSFTYSGYSARAVYTFDSTKKNHFVVDSSWRSQFYPERQTRQNCGYQLKDELYNCDWIGSNVLINAQTSDFEDDKFTVLINNGTLSAVGISKYNVLQEAGVLLSDWFSVNTNKDITITKNAISFFTGDKITLIETTSNEYDFDVINNYLIVKTNTAFCSYNIKEKRIEMYAIDYNQRISLSNAYGTGSAINSNDSLKDGLFQTSINPFPEITQKATGSIQNNAIPLEGMINPEFYGNGTLISGMQAPEGFLFQVDFFYNFEAQATAAIYQGSVIFTNSSPSLPGVIVAYNELIIDDEIKGLSLPTATDGNILINTALFSKVIASYSNNDIVIAGDSGYLIAYINNKFTFNYFIFSGFFGLEGSFVLQGQRYVFNEIMLFITDTTNGILTNTLPLVDISGYIFLGHNTKEALFFSESERAFFSFYGDRTLTKIADTDSITDIYNTYYNQNTQTIIVHSNRGFIFIREAESFIVSGEITDTITVTETGFIINKDLEADFYSYFEVEGYEQEENDLQTCYMGLDEFTNTRYECWYMKFFSARRLSGTITFSEKAITDKNFEGKTKTLTVKESDWDSNNTLYVRYRPSIQNAVAVSIGVKCPFDIYSMAVKMGTSQDPVLSRFNV